MPIIMPLTAARPTPEVSVSLRIVLGGSSSQRLLVALIQRLEEGRLMMAIDHKGRLAYANTALASLLGYKLPALRAKDIFSLMPPPFNMMHIKWLKARGHAMRGLTRGACGGFGTVCSVGQPACDLPSCSDVAPNRPLLSPIFWAQDAETMDARQSPGSCRSGSTVHLSSTNGQLVPVKASISHQPGSLGHPALWAVTLTRSSEAAANDERRLLLLVRMDGTIAAASSGTPISLFGIDPARLAGSRLDRIVDVFHSHAEAGERGRGWVAQRNLGPAAAAWIVAVGAHVPFSGFAVADKGSAP